MSNTVCNAVTRSVSNAVRRCVQNQNQNQTVVKAVCGSSLVTHSIQRFGSFQPSSQRKTDDGFAVMVGGER